MAEVSSVREGAVSPQFLATPLTVVLKVVAFSAEVDKDTDYNSSGVTINSDPPQQEFASEALRPISVKAFLLHRQTFM